LDRERGKTFPGRVPQNCRSLGFAQDDKKERVVVRRRRLLKERADDAGGNSR
jgi:hypothetical protein